MDDPDQHRDKSLGPTWILLALAAAPFLAKSYVLFAAVTGYLGQLSYKMFQLAAPVFWRRRYGRRRLLACFWPVDEPLPDATTWALAVSVAVTLAGAAACAVIGLHEILGIDPVLIKNDLDAKFGLTTFRAILIVVYLFTINAALEELHFRAWLDREVSRRWGDLVGVLLSAGAFAAMHVFIFAGVASVGTVVFLLLFAALFIAGVAWSLIARRPGGIHAAWLSHGLTDAALLTWGLSWLGYF